MKNTKIILIGIIIYIISFFCLFPGIKWGIPSKERIDLLPKFSKTESIIKKWKKVSNSSEISVNISGGRINKKESIDRWLQAFYLYSEHPDEHQIFLAFSRIKPSKLKFDPHLYSYGGAFMYPLGIWLKIMSIFGKVKLISDLNFYFNNISEFGKLYIYSRYFCILICALTPVAVFICCFVFTNSLLSSIISAFLMILCPAFLAWSRFLSPHFYVQLFLVLTIIFSLLFYKEKKKKYLILSSIFAGISLGTVITSGFIFLFIILIILNKKKSFFYNIKLILYSYFTMFFVYLITNPYVLISFKEFKKEISFGQSWWKFKISYESIINMLFYIIPYGAGISISILFCISILFIFIKKHSRPFYYLITTYFIFIIYISFQTAGHIKNPQLTRFILPVFPVLCIITGVFFNYIKNKNNIYLIIFFIFLLGNIPLDLYYINNFINASSINSVSLKAGKWINKNIYENSKIGISQYPAPYKCPPFNFSKYKISILKKGVFPDYIIIKNKNILPKYSDYKIIQKFFYNRDIFKMKFKENKMFVNNSVFILKKKIR